MTSINPESQPPSLVTFDHAARRVEMDFRPQPVEVEPDDVALDPKGLSALESALSSRASGPVSLPNK